MRYIGVTGARWLHNDKQHALVRAVLLQVLVPGETYLLVGDATGVDGKARSLARHVGIPESHTFIYRVEGKREAWKLQQRSKQMVDELAFSMQQGKRVELHAFPNKPCPDGITADCWQGSGTWGTVMYARAINVPVVVHSLTKDAIESQPQQLSLFS